MKLRFDEKKTTELATAFLRMNGGQMAYLKLMKLLYIADREAINQFGSPITGDHYVSMNYGPVLSKTYDIIKSPPEPGKGYTGEIWNERIAKINYDLRLTRDLEPDLSEADAEIARAIFEKYRDHDRWTVADNTHEFPEWRDPDGSTLPIDYEDILKALGKSKEESKDTLGRLSMKAFLQDYSRRG